MSYLVWPAYMALGWVSPWWLLLVAGCTTGILENNRLRLSLISFWGAFVVWFSVIGILDFKADFAAGQPLAGMLKLNAPWQLWLFLGSFAGLVSLSCAWLGFWMKISKQSGRVSR